MSTTLLLQPTSQIAAPQPPRLLDQIAQAARQHRAFPTSPQPCRCSRSCGGSRSQCCPPPRRRPTSPASSTPYSDASASGEADAAEPFEPIEREKRALVTMPGGWQMSQLQAWQPTTGHKEFVEVILNEIACCLNMPLCVAAGNSSGYNDTSGRLDHQTYFKAIRIEQAHLEDVVLERILAAWFDEADTSW